VIRPERGDDLEAIRRVNLSAFTTPLEANLVEALRLLAQPVVSLVAVRGDEIVGHILFSPATLASDPALAVMGLAPMAVSPERQRQGIGSQLVAAGLEACRESGCAAAVVLGHADYYPRFGFTPASRFGLSCEYDVPDEVFMALELTPGALQGRSGLVRYHPAFASF
jgi:putative acetyltransferase